MLPGSRRKYYASSIFLMVCTFVSMILTIVLALTLSCVATAAGERKAVLPLTSHSKYTKEVTIHRTGSEVLRGVFTSYLVHALRNPKVAGNPECTWKDLCDRLWWIKSPQMPIAYGARIDAPVWFRETKA